MYFQVVLYAHDCSCIYLVHVHPYLSPEPLYPIVYFTLVGLKHKHTYVQVLALSMHVYPYILYYSRL